MNQVGSTQENFARLRNELVRENRADLRDETLYFLSHERRFASDLALVSELYESGRILEVGGYPFFFTAILKSLGFPVVSADRHPLRAVPLLRRSGLEVVACDAETQHLPFDDQSFDYLLFNEILEHLRIDPLFALSECNRVLRPGGLLLLSTPNLYFVKNVAKLLLGRGFNDPVQEFGKLRAIGHMGHVREYTPGEVRRFLQVSGFAVQRQELRQYNYPRGPLGLAGIAARGLLWALPPLRGYQVVVASKAGPGPGLAPLSAH